MPKGRNDNNNKLFNAILRIEYCGKVFPVYIGSFIHCRSIDKKCKNCQIVMLYRTIAHVYFDKMAIFVNIAAFWLI